MNSPLTAAALDGIGAPPDGWPEWVFSMPYDGDLHPHSDPGAPLDAGGNCQRYAHAVLALFGREVPPYWSSDLWEDEHFEHPAVAEDLDIVLVNREPDSFAAHLGVVLGGQVLHLCAEIGRPALWGWEEFAARERYREVVGFVRVPETVRGAI